MQSEFSRLLLKFVPLGRLGSVAADGVPLISYPARGQVSLRFTLDTNCIIDVEDNRACAPYVRTLVDLHRAGQIIVAVSAIGASESLRSGGYAATFSEFQSKLSGINFDSLELLPPRACLGLAYFDYYVLADDSDTLEQDIHTVLFPTIEFLWEDFASARGLPIDGSDKQWRNAKCDVLTLCCYIQHDGDVFVTSDSNFHKKSSVLSALGAKVIASPQEAVIIAQGGQRSPNR